MNFAMKLFRIALSRVRRSSQLSPLRCSIVDWFLRMRGWTVKRLGAIGLDRILCEMCILLESEPCVMYSCDPQIFAWQSSDSDLARVLFIVRCEILDWDSRLKLSCPVKPVAFCVLPNSGRQSMLRLTLLDKGSR